MGRKRHYAPLRVLLNNRMVGHLVKEPGGGIEFRYDQSWLERELVFPVSLSLLFLNSGSRLDQWREGRRRL